MRLHRPYIPADVKLRVALRQLDFPYINALVAIGKRDGTLLKLLATEKQRLADKLGCRVEDLRLDHDPALENRQRIRTNSEPCGYRYLPDANDPEHLFYRSHASHDIKTRVRGDHGQYSDNMLAKRERRRLKKKSRKRTKWPTRKLRSASRWPKGRKLRWKK